MKKRRLISSSRRLFPLLILSVVTGIMVQAQQELAITGTVRDAQSGNALSGVTVTGAGSAVVTNESGVFSIGLKLPAKLVFSSVGYTSLTVNVTNAQPLNIELLQESQSLGEVVVVGYGTQSRKSLTSSISTIASKELTSLPSTNIGNNLGGRASGVMIKQSSGEPGSDGATINLRGLGTIGSSAPLTVVDGIPRGFQDLNPNDIEDITILKDAAAVAPYGVAGANGVILITTKKGKTGKPKINYNGYIGFQSAANPPKYVDGYHYALLRNEGAKNSGSINLPYDDAALETFKNGTDPDVYFNPDPWNYLIKKNQILTNHSLSVSGGTENVTYYLGLGYMYQKGMWPTADLNRYNLNANIEAQATKTTKIGFNLNTRTIEDRRSAVGSSRIFELIGFANPSFGNGVIQYTNGLFGQWAIADIYESGYNKKNTNEFTSKLSIEQRLPFIQGLKFQGAIAYDPTYVFSKTWRTPTTVYGLVDPNATPREYKGAIVEQNKASLNQSVSRGYGLTYQAGFNYDRRFRDHNIGGLVLFEARSISSLNWGLSRKNYELDIDEINMGSSSGSDMATSGSSSMTRQVGLVYRVNYNFREKYLLEASGRYDGHYYFAPGKRFGFFPAVSAGWRISEENFLKDVSWLDDLKFRVSYGESGNLAGAPFQYLSSFNGRNSVYEINGNILNGLVESSEANVDITWERSKKRNIGVDATIFNHLINFSFDYFFEKRSNMLIAPDVTTPLEYGIALSQVNAGIMDNRGIELSGGFEKTIGKNLHIGLAGNFSWAKNKMVNLFESESTFNNPNRRMTGRSWGTQFGYRAIGYFQPEDFDHDGNLLPGIPVQPWGKVSPGDIRYEDVSGDGNFSSDDFVPIGYPSAIPRIYYGFSPRISYKNFSLDVLFQGAAKSNFYITEIDWAFFNQRSAFDSHFDYWTPENRDASYPRITSAPTPNNTQTSSFWMKNTSYMRLKNATLSYTLDHLVASKLKINQGTIYISGQNLLTWSHLTNFDPENMNSGGRGYPQMRTFSVGINITF